VTVTEKRARIVAALTEAEGHLQAMTNRPGGRPEDSPDAFALYMFAATARNRVRAVRLLLEHDALPDAAVLVRTLFEMCVSAHYICCASLGERTQRGKRFLCMESIHREHIIQQVIGAANPALKQRLLKSRGEPQWTELHNQADACRREFPNASARTDWSGLEYAEMIKHIEGHPNTQEALENDHRVHYQALSGYAHPTVTGVQSALSGSEPEGLLVNLAILALKWTVSIWEAYNGRRCNETDAVARLFAEIDSATEL
jgi:hypothetical protein